MKRKLALFLALCMAGVMALTACGGDASSASQVSQSTPAAGSGSSASGTGDELNATLEYWCSWSSTEPQAQVLEAAAKAFNELHPGVTINFTFNGRDNRKLLTPAIEAGTQIDMMDANADNMMSLWIDHIKPLDEFYGQVYPTTGGKPYEECIMPSMITLAETVGDGTKYYIPYTPQGFLFFYNKEIFAAAGVDKVPATWEEFLDTCEKIKAAGYIPLTTDGAYAPAILGYLLDRMKGDAWVIDLVNDASKETWSDPAVLEAAQMIEDLAAKGYYAPNVASNQHPAAQQEMVIEEKIAMYLNGTWLPNEVKDTAKEDFQWGQFPFPTVPGGVDGLEGGAYSSWGIAVNKNADDATTAAAVAFAVYLTTSEWDQTMSETASAIPMSLGADWPESLQDSQAAFAGYTKRYQAQTGIRMNAEMLPIIQTGVMNLMSGQYTAEQFIAEMQK